MLAFRVYSAASGETFTCRLDIENFKITVFKSSLATFSGIAPNDQILLVGPPYKVLDTNFGPDMCSNGQKIFMFDKRIISEVGAEPLIVKLKPYVIPEPALIDAPMSSCLAESSSPMLRAVPDYEKQFLTHIRRGETFLLAVEQSVQSCKRCLEQIEVQQLSLEAAISNLNDHYTATKNSFENKQQKIIVQQQAHKALLDKFDDNFQQLGDITLHSSLQALLTDCSSLTESGDNCKENVLVTLRDTIPVEKEFAWRDKCRQSHQKVEENMAQLQIIFDNIALSMNKIGVQSDSPYSLEELMEFSATLESNASTQKNHMDDLRESYRVAVEEISNLLHCEEGEREGKITELFTLLESSRKSQEQAIKPMEICCIESMQLKDKFAETKTNITKNIFHTLRGIAAVQTDIQFKLKKGMELMTRWRQGHNGYFQHLERIQALPEAYATFLHEMIRRGKYTQEFEELVKTSVDTISAFRAQETSQREKFMADMGSCLPPIFFEIIPSLLEKPPFFNATITERQFIPDISLEDSDVRDMLEPYGLELGGVAGQDGAEKTSSNTKKNNDSLNSNHEDSGATLTSSDSLSGSHSARNIDNENVEALAKHSYADSHIDSDNSNIKLQLEEKLKLLEEENRQLRQLASVNLRSQLMPTAMVDQSGESHAVAQHVVMTTTASKDNDSSNSYAAEEGTARKHILGACLDTELAALLLDVLQLKHSVDKCLSSQHTSTPEQATTQSQIAEVVSLVQGIHSLSLSAKEDAMQLMKHIGAEGSTVKPGKNSSIPQISFLKLSVGDIALFLPTNKRDTFLAFTHELPYYYLSQDSLAHFKNQNGDPPNYILGQIIFIDERIASKDVPSNIGSAQTPKILPPGIIYNLLEIVPVDFTSK